MFVDYDFNGYVQKVPINIVPRLKLFEWVSIRTVDSGVCVFGNLQGQIYTLKAIRKILSQDSEYRRVMSHVTVRYGKFDCWDWSGALSTSGYPMARVEKQTIYIRNVFFEAIGKFKPTEKFKSKCHNKLCMRPSHYELKEQKARPKLKQLSQPHTGKR